MEGAQNVEIKVRTTDATRFVADGRMVTIVTCLECGAAIFLDGLHHDDDFHPIIQHLQWHEKWHR